MGKAATQNLPCYPFLSNFKKFPNKLLYQKQNSYKISQEQKAFVNIFEVDHFQYSFKYTRKR